jgi:SpoU rRNA methylase family enzyme
MRFNSTWVYINNVVQAAQAVLANEPDAVTRLRDAVAALDSDNNLASEAEIEAAQNIHESDEVEVDSVPLVSRADGGYWVSASVWVPATD